MPLSNRRLLALALALAPMLALVSCGLVEWPGRAEDRGAARPVAPSAPTAAPPVDLGDPYKIDGVEYRPMDSRTLDETGYAGLSADLDGVSIAHKTLPIPSYVELTDLGSGRTILARVIERGPMSNGRLTDLSCAAASQLSLTGGQLVPVRVRRIRPTPPDAGALDRGERAAERLPAPKPMLAALTKKLPPAPKGQSAGDPCAEIPPASPPIGAKSVVPRPAPPPPASAPRPAAAPAKSPVVEKSAVENGFIVEEGGKAPVAHAARPAVPAPSRPAAAGAAFAVQAGAFSSRAQADAVAARIGGRVEPVGSLYRVRTEPYASRATASKALATIRAKGFADAVIVPMDSR